MNMVNVEKINKEEIQKNVISLIKEMAFLEDIDLRKNIFEQMKADSIDVLEFIVMLEDEFEIEFDVNSLPNDYSVLFITEVIFEKLEQKRILNYEHQNK